MFDAANFEWKYTFDQETTIKVGPPATLDGVDRWQQYAAALEEELVSRTKQSYKPYSKQVTVILHEREEYRQGMLHNRAVIAKLVGALGSIEHQLTRASGDDYLSLVRRVCDLKDFLRIVQKPISAKDVYREESDGS